MTNSDRGWHWCCWSSARSSSTQRIPQISAGKEETWRRETTHHFSFGPCIRGACPCKHHVCSYFKSCKNHGQGDSWSGVMYSWQAIDAAKCPQKVHQSDSWCKTEDYGGRVEREAREIHTASYRFTSSGEGPQVWSNMVRAAAIWLRFKCKFLNEGTVKEVCRKFEVREKQLSKILSGSKYKGGTDPKKDMKGPLAKNINPWGCMLLLNSLNRKMMMTMMIHLHHQQKKAEVPWRSGPTEAHSRST